MTRSLPRPTLRPRMSEWRRYASGRRTRISRNASSESAWSRWIGRRNLIRDADAVRAKFGVAPAFIPDYLALVGDAADGYPGIAGYGPKTAAQLINRYGRLEDFPLEILKEGNLDHALLFKTLATLRIDAPLFGDVEQLRWRGATSGFGLVAERVGDPRLVSRVVGLETRLSERSPAG